MGMGPEHGRFLIRSEAKNQGSAKRVLIVRTMMMNKNMDEDKNIDNNSVDEEIQRLMREHDIDEDTAEKARGVVDEGLDEGEAIELAEEI
jgi:hypothetical protein